MSQKQERAANGGAMDQEDIDALRDAARDTLEALGAILTADFDADDSGSMQHVVETEEV